LRLTKGVRDKTGHPPGPNKASIISQSVPKKVHSTKKKVNTQAEGVRDETRKSHHHNAQEKNPLVDKYRDKGVVNNTAEGVKEGNGGRRVTFWKSSHIES